MMKLFSFFSALLICFEAYGSEFEMNTAQMQAMDKITGRVSIIEVPVNGEVTFGSFSVVVRSCKARSEEEIPENFAFVDVTDKSFDKEEYNIFKGWMLSSSPAVNAIEHPIYDVWLLKCVDKEVKPEDLLSEEQLAKRDDLPRLQEVKEMQKQMEENTFEAEDVTNISFKDSMYKEDKPQESVSALENKKDGEPQNLLNIEPIEDAEQMVEMPADEFEKAVHAEAESLTEEKSIEDLEKELTEQALEVQEDALNEPEDLTAEINAELKN